MIQKALVADDDDLMRAFIRLALGALDITDVEEAADGDEALRLFQQQPFDLLLLDWHMPGRSGLEVIRAVRASGCPVPAIMVTAEAERELVLTAIEAGASDYIIKPFEPALLWTKLQKYLGGAQAEAGRRGDREVSGARAKGAAADLAPR